MVAEKPIYRDVGEEDGGTARLQGWWRQSQFTWMVAAKLTFQDDGEEGGSTAYLPGWGRKSLFTGDDSGKA